MKKYSEDLVSKGNFKADNINSRIMELADELATKDALAEWGETRAGFYVEADDKNGTTLSDEAHDVYLGYYEKHINTLYKFTNDIIEIDAPTPEDIAIQKLSCYICDDEDRYSNIAEAYQLLLAQADLDGDVDANEIVLVWGHLDGYTVDGILELI